MKKELSALGYTQTDEKMFIRFSKRHKWYRKNYNFYLDIIIEEYGEKLSVYISQDDGFQVIRHGATMEWIKDFDNLLSA